MKKILIYSLVGSVFLVFNQNSFAEVVQRAESASTARIQMMLRQVAADRDALKAENGKQKAEIDKLKKQIDKLKDEKTSLSRKLDHGGKVIAKYSEVNGKLRDRISRDIDRTREVIKKFRETIITLKQLEIQKNKVYAQLASRNKQLNTCVVDNDKLYKTNLELVKLYKKKSVWQALLQKEPLTQIERVAIENIGEKYESEMQNYRYANNDSN